MSRPPVTAAAEPLDRTSPLPLWAQLAEQLRAQIGAGTFEDRFPTEHELTERYGVSRHTVREAIRKLQSEGLLSRERGRGTFVARPEFRQDLGTLYSLYRTIEAQGVSQFNEVLDLGERTSPEVADRLGLPSTGAFVFLKRLRYAGGEPLALEEAWLPPDCAAGLAAADLEHSALYDVLQEQCGILPIGGTEEIRPVVPTDRECALLGVEPGTPAFSLERLTRTTAGFIEWRRTLLRGDRFSFVADWTNTELGSPRLEVTG